MKVTESGAKSHLWRGPDHPEVRRGRPRDLGDCRASSKARVVAAPCSLVAAVPLEVGSLEKTIQDHALGPLMPFSISILLSQVILGIIDVHWEAQSSCS